MKKTVTGILSVLLALWLTAGVFTLLVSAAPEAAWDGTTVAESFAGGQGTEAEPYRIGTAAQLAYLAKTVNEKTDYTGVYFTQTADIDLGEKSRTPIGGAQGSFKGIYDGGGFSVTGLNCDMIAAEGNAKEYAGLFGSASGATIRNLRVTGSRVRSNKFAGAIVGHGKNLMTIFNCSSKIEAIDGASAGGIAGRIDFSEFNSEERNLVVACVSDSNIRTTGNVSEDGNTGRSYTYCGGIVGASIATVVAYCTNNGDLDLIPLLNKAYPIWSGGIVGVNGSNTFQSSIYFCTNNGNIRTYQKYDVSALLEKAPGTVVNTYENIFRIGGIAGHFTNKVEGCAVAGCLNTGKVEIYLSNTGTEVLKPEDSESQRAGGILALANKSCLSAANYTVQLPGIGVDKSGCSVEESIVAVTPEQLRGEAGLTVMDRGYTLEKLIPLLVSHTLARSYYTENEIREMEKKLEGGSMSEYLVDFVSKKLAADGVSLEGLWKTDEAGEPKVADAGKALEAAGLIAEVRTLANQELDRIAEGGDPDAPSDDGEDDGLSDEKPPVTPGDSSSPSDTGKETKKPGDTDTPKKKSGCRSSVSAAGILVVVGSCFGAVAWTGKKRRK